MNEKLYKAMGSSAVSSLVIGICVLATGVAAGVLLIINGAKLLKHKSKILLYILSPEPLCSGIFSFNFNVNLIILSG